MSDSNLKKSCNDLIEKITKDYDLIKSKVNGLDTKEVAKKPLIYDKVKPIVDGFQDDLVDVTSKIYNIINDLNTTLSDFFDSVEKDLELLDESELENEIVEEDLEENEDLDNLQGPEIIVNIE
jgi:hypothetical protein